MKFNSITFNKNALSVVLLLVRVFVGFAMISHGFPKLQKLLSGEEIQFFNFLGMGALASLILTVFAEFVCSMFIILGLFTRTFLIPLMITMFVAGVVVHSADAFGERELSLVYLCIYLLIFVIGAGRFSIDAMMAKKTRVNY